MAILMGITLETELGDGAMPSEGFNPVAHGRLHNWVLDNQPVEVTNQDSGGYRELAAGQHIQMSGDFTGVVDDGDTTIDDIETVINSSDPFLNIKFDDGTGKKWSMNAAITNFSLGGAFDAEMEVSFHFESNGTITYA